MIPHESSLRWKPSVLCEGRVAGDLPLVFCQPIWCLNFPACGLWLPPRCIEVTFL